MNRISSIFLIVVGVAAVMLTNHVRLLTIEKEALLVAEERAEAKRVLRESWTIVPGVGAGELKFGMLFKDVFIVLGQHDLKDGPDFFWFELGIEARLADRRLAALHFHGERAGGRRYFSFIGRTEEGIGIGATREALVAAMGEPDRISSLYEYLDPQVSFEFDDENRVSSIHLLVASSEPES